MGSGGGDQQVTQTQKAEPWSVAQPWATSLVGQTGLLPTYQNWIQGLVTNHGQGYGTPGSVNPFIYSGNIPTGAGFDVNNFVSPWTPMQSNAADAVQNLASTATSNSSQIPQYIQQWTQGLLDNTAGGGGAANDIMNQANASFFSPTIQGQMLDPSTNKYLEAYGNAAIAPIQDTLNRTLANIGATASSSGRYGSSAWTDLNSKAMKDAEAQMGNTLAQIYEPAYQQERGLQQNAANSALNFWQDVQGNKQRAAQTMLGAGSLQNQNLTDAANLWNQTYNYGTAQQQMGQAGLQAAQNAYNQYYFGPEQMLSGLTSIAYGMPWSNKTSSTPLYQPSFMQSLAGAAGTGLGMYGMTGDPSISALMAGMGLM